MKNKVFYYSLKNNFILKTNRDFQKEDIPILFKPYLLNENEIMKENIGQQCVIDELCFFEQFYGYRY